MRYLFGDYALDTRCCELRHTGTLIKLRPKVFDVLTYLIAHCDRVISRQELLEHLWPQQFVGEATLNSCIMEARQAIGDTGQVQRLIQTLHGRGYRFVAVVEEVSDSLPGTMRSSLVPRRALALANLGQTVAHQPVPGGNRVAIVTNAGGPAILAADACEAHGLRVPVLAESTQRALREFLPATAAVGNPVDMIASATP